MQTANAEPPVKITGRHVAVTEPIREYAASRLGHLHLDYPRIIEAQFILDVEKHRHMAELILHCANHITIEASAETTDLYASIDEVTAKVAQQMRKYKTRLLRSHRPRKHEVKHFDEHVIDLDGFDHDHEPDPQVVKTEKYAIKPMFVDEAMLQMEMMKQKQFMVFLNPKTEQVSVLYRRKDGHFGLIEPTV